MAETRVKCSREARRPYNRPTLGERVSDEAYAEMARAAIAALALLDG
jgi:hypothetical protein